MDCFSYPTLRECWLKELTYCIKEQQRRGKIEQGNLKAKSTTSVNLSHGLCLKGMREEQSFHPLNAEMRVIVERKRKIFSFPPSSEKA